MNKKKISLITVYNKYLFTTFKITEIENSFPYKDVKLQKGSVSKDVYDITKEELGR